MSRNQKLHTLGQLALQMKMSLHIVSVLISVSMEMQRILPIPGKQSVTTVDSYVMESSLLLQQIVQTLVIALSQTFSPSQR